MIVRISEGRAVYAQALQFKPRRRHAELVSASTIGRVTAVGWEKVRGNKRRHGLNRGP
jgi:hypothetical protein